MEENNQIRKSPRLIDWLISLAVAALAGAVCSLSVVDSASPGFEADTIASWLGLDVQDHNPYVLAGFFAKMFGFSAFFAPLCAMALTLCLFHSVNVYLRRSFGDHFTEDRKIFISRTGAIASSAVFVFTPCVFDSATHLGPALFDALWAMLAITVFIPYPKLPKSLSWILPFASGALVMLGFADTVAFMLLVPFCGAVAWVVSSRSARLGYVATGFFILGFIVAIPLALSAIGGFDAYVKAQKEFFAGEFAYSKWIYALFLAVIPFLISLFSTASAFASEKAGGIVNLLYHFILSIVAVLAVASPVSVSSTLGYSGYQPVMIALMTAAMAGYLFAYWSSLAATPPAIDPVTKIEHGNSRNLRNIGRIGAMGLSFVLVLSMAINIFFNLDLGAVKSFDEISRRVVSSMGERTWIVTDGVIDDGVRIAAFRQGKKINVVSLIREGDKTYLDNLAATVRAKKLGGDKLSKELSDILSKDDGIERQRLLPFIEHWFRNDPDVASKVVVWGAPHLWMNVEMGPLPELYFFTCEDEGRNPGDWVKEWASVKDCLKVPEDWGSYRIGMYKDKSKKSFVDSRERNIRNLRRHIGLLAASQGNFHHFNGLKLSENGKTAEAQAEFEKAFALYELVLNEIDPDNLSALINEKFLADKNGLKKAVDKLKVIEQSLAAVYKDTNRRYDPVQLSLLYGTLCDPNFMFSYGQALISRRGQYAHGVFQIRRAIDLIPADQRKLAEFNILAHYFSEGTEAHKIKARNIYLEQLKSDPGNKMALVRLSNLEALEGNVEKAKEYLERALKGSENDVAFAKQLAQLCLLKNDLRGAENALRRAIDSDPKDIHAWALLTHVLIRDIDNMGEVEAGSKRAQRKEALLKEIETDILSVMEAIAADGSVVDNEVIYRSTKALFLMRKGGVENIRDARDSFEAVSKTRRVSSRTGDMILSLDMQLNDKEHAEEKAKTILMTNPSDPMANYIMGSLCLQRGENDAAEGHLRKAVSGNRTVPLAYNDLAEALRRRGAFEEAEKMARDAVRIMPKLYVAWETLGSILMASGKSSEEAEKCIEKACELSKDATGGAADVRMLISLARVQLKRGQKLRAKGTMRVVQSRMNELTEYEKKEFEELMKSVK